MIEPCPKCGREFKSKSGKTLHEKKCDAVEVVSAEEIKELWDITAVATAMGDIHDPSNKPVVVVYGTRIKKATRGETNIHFRAIMSENSRKIYYCTKATEKRYGKEVKIILDNWVYFAKETSLQPSVVGICYVCKARNVPGTYVHFSGICVFCMLQRVATWMGGLKL